MDWREGASHGEIAASFSKLATLGERIGGEYGIAARFLRTKADAMAATRIRERNDLILILRRDFYASLANRKAAEAIYRDLSRYRLGAWKRGDHRLEKPLLNYGGREHALFFWILKISPKMIGQSMIRRILDDAATAKIARLDSGRHLPLDMSRGSRSADMSIANVMEFIQLSPEISAAVARREADVVAARKRALETIARLDAKAAKDYGKRVEAVEKSLADHRAAQLALKSAEAAHGALVYAQSVERFAYETARREAEAVLLAGEWPEIEQFIEFCDREHAVALKSLETLETAVRNERTGRVDRVGHSNSASVNKRAKAIVDSRRAAWDLRLIVDPKDLPSRIAQIKASWPVIAPAAPPQAA